MEREYIKLSKYYLTQYYKEILSAILIGGFIGAIIHWNYVARDYKALNPEAEIRPVIINGSEGWGRLRSSVFYKKNHFIPSTILVEADCDESILEKLDIEKSTLKNSYNGLRTDLYDLDMPYELSKKRNSDTIIVKKGSCMLKFLMLEYDGPYK